MARNFLLGRGENLVVPLKYTDGGGTKYYPYSFSDNLTALAPLLAAAGRSVEKISRAKMPNDEAVIAITLHPAFMARSYFPDDLLLKTGLKLIGSRPRIVTPRLPDKEIRLKPGDPVLAEETPELLVAGSRKVLAGLVDVIRSLPETSQAAKDFSKIEDIRIQTAAERVHLTGYNILPKTTMAWEIVLHAAPSSGDYVVSSFLDFVRQKGGPGLYVDESRRIYAGGLCFLPARGTLEQMNAAAEFSFLRCARPMPKLNREAMRTSGGDVILCDLPDSPAISPNMRALVLDGGKPKNANALDRWITCIEAPGIGKRNPIYEHHGLSVLSAGLFGPIRNGQEVAPPVCHIDLVRVVDADTEADPDDFEYIDSLARIRDYLLSHGSKYDFICLCCGPCVPIDDGDPSAWTATLDPIFGGLKGLAFSAVGNGGLWDKASGRSRIQPPSDAVNLMAIGACCSTDKPRKKWARAPHSCVGPGRRPGVVRPDAVCFGGHVPEEPFYTVGTTPGTAVAGMGTSLAAPYAMRTAAGVKASLGEQVNALALKALLINRSSRPTKQSVLDVGWGRIMESPSELISTADNEVVVIYQGTLPPSIWQTAEIPIPRDLPGQFRISATFCFSTMTDPHHPVNYTRSCLEVTFRPHSERFDEERQQRGNSDSFFKARTMYQRESQLRREAFKWETVLHRTRKFNGNDLRDPCFDIIYSQREEGHNASEPLPVSYALVVRVKAFDVSDFYNRVFRHYRNLLVPLRPVLTLPVNFS